MNFQWNLFEFTITDCQLLSKALKATPTLEIFRLRESKVDNERGRVLIAHLLDHPALRILGNSIIITPRMNLYIIQSLRYFS